MNKLIINVLCAFLFSTVAFSQTINDLINKVSLDSLVKTVNEFSGEVPTVVNGNTVTISSRISNNNDVAADYIKQKFQQFDNLTITDQVYSANGRNIIATQIGKTNPNDIYIVCAHYDSVTSYCADDNASGTATVLEIARILSAQCLDNTIVYALWDEEENGLLGANYYATQASNNSANILGVLNIDMMAHDGNNDNNFDIDVLPIANSIAMKDDLLNVLSTHGFNLVVNVVNPGTEYSDHSRFWNNGYSAVLVGESWATSDRTPHYHLPTDRIQYFNLPYYHELAKFIFAYMVTKGGLVNVDNTITASGSTLTANQSSATYQWYNCDTDMAISGATNQSYAPTFNGTFAVEVTSGTCTERSECTLFNTLGLSSFNSDDIILYPNPVENELKIELKVGGEVTMSLFNISGKLIVTHTLQQRKNSINLKDVPSGVYFVNIRTSQKTGTYKIVKE
ncbi:MAG: M28 family peptidase [Gelidibacter sp.]|nr:M28 family peptidase [Gelidibacter sp.]